MLVLSRKCHEKIRIGDSIVISIVRIEGSVVRIGIEAPRHIRVRRAELPPHLPDAAESSQADTFAEPSPLRARPAAKAAGTKDSGQNEDGQEDTATAARDSEARCKPLAARLRRRLPVYRGVPATAATAGCPTAAPRRLSRISSSEPGDNLRVALPVASATRCLGEK